MTDLSSRMRLHAQAQREAWAIDLAGPDRELLQMRDVEKLTLRKIGTRLGVSYNAVRYRLEAARRREKVRQAIEQKLAERRARTEAALALNGEAG